MTSQTTAQCFMGPINCHAGTFTTGHVREEITFSILVNCTHRNKIHSKCFIKIDFISLTKIHNFFPRPVLAYGYCRCLCLSVCVSVRQSLACPRDNSGPVQARITKFGPKIQNSLIKVPIFLFVSSFQLYFNFFNYQPWQRILSITMCCVVMTSVFSWYFPMEWNADCFFACICRICVCVHFLHRCQYCHTRFNALVWLYVNMYFISHKHIILL